GTCLMSRRSPRSPPFPYTTLFRSDHKGARHREAHGGRMEAVVHQALGDVFGRDAADVLDGPNVENALVRDAAVGARVQDGIVVADRKSTRLNSSHVKISYAVFCLK